MRAPARALLHMRAKPATLADLVTGRVTVRGGHVPQVGESEVKQLSVPTIVAGVENSLAAMSPRQLPLWEKLRLEPAFARINLTYAILAPPVLQTAVTTCTAALALVYELCNLGSMAPISNLFLPLETTV